MTRKPPKFIGDTTPGDVRLIDSLVYVPGPARDADEMQMEIALALGRRKPSEFDIPPEEIYRRAAEVRRKAIADAEAAGDEA